MKISWLLIPLIFLSPQLVAFSQDSYIKNLKAGPITGPAESKVLGALSNCSNANTMTGDCIIPQLSPLAQNENNALAASILSEYSRALSEGKMNSVAECRTTAHLETDNVLARCVLIMNYYALKEQNKDSGITNYGLCLQGGLSGLAFGGNLSARHLLSQLYLQGGNREASEMWSKSLELEPNKGTLEYQLMRKCYP